MRKSFFLTMTYRVYVDVLKFADELKMNYRYTYLASKYMFQ